MKSLTEMLAAVGLIRPVRSSGVCPACKGWVSGTGDPTPRARREVDPAALTALAALVAGLIFLAVPAALVVFVRFFLARNERWWAFYCLASAVLMLVIFFGGIGNATLAPLTLRLAVLIGWVATSLIAVRLLCDPDPAYQASETTKTAFAHAQT